MCISKKTEFNLHKKNFVINLRRIVLHFLLPINSYGSLTTLSLPWVILLVARVLERQMMAKNGEEFLRDLKEKRINLFVP